ncbi:MAG: diguanylate cyclase [Kiloniellales bacterium]
MAADAEDFQRLSVFLVSRAEGDIPQRVETEEILNLYRRWVEESRAANGLPDYKYFNLNSLSEIADHLMILQPIACDAAENETAKDLDFLYLHYGAGIAEKSGFDMTGRMVSEFKGELGRFFRSTYQTVLKRRLPQYTSHFSEHAAQVHTWERLMLPVTDASGRPLVVVYNRPKHTRVDLIDAILESSLDGVFYIAALRDLSSEIEDFIFVMSNPKASEILGKSPEDYLYRRLCDVFPGATESRAFEAYVRVATTGTPETFRLHYPHDGLNKHFDISAVRCGDGVAVTFSDITEMVEMQQYVERQRDELIAATTSLQEQAAAIAQLAEDREQALNRMRAEIEQRKEAEKKLIRQATTDPLTGIANRRTFMERARSELVRARRYSESLSVMVMDLDHFKAINDAHGHQAGDRVLIEVARRISKTVRDSVDVFARLGGEEFVVLMPETGLEGALNLGERLRAVIADTPVTQDGGPAIKVTTSVGAATLQPGDLAIDSLLNRADAALYQAKDAGRDRVAA